MRGGILVVALATSAILSAPLPALLPGLVLPQESRLEEGVAAYRHGDWAHALAILRPLAIQENAEAQELLARLYERGKGVPRSYEKAFEWYLKAAEKGHPYAESHLGFFYRAGIVAPVDYQLALYWYRKGAEQNNRLAEVGLGYMYLGGEGIAQDEATAIGLFHAAAAQGDAKAMLMLGSLYLRDRSISNDPLKVYASNEPVKAYMWFWLAAHAHDDEYEDDIVDRAWRELDDVAAHMTPQQISEGERLARQWKASKPAG